MDMLMTVQALQYPLLDLLLDVMLMCCQHLIMLEGQSWDLNDTEEDDQLEAESLSDSGREADAVHSGEKVKGKVHAGTVPESTHMQGAPLPCCCTRRVAVGFTKVSSESTQPEPFHSFAPVTRAHC